ncbi:hypothetical protein CEXT_539851 [Caerostris extrusa]|uniref:LAGLIDADG homing endonuclease n=1 Tax=Caerostris extrusa TaxID=172846 RepID=A0AAV4Q0E9_CAEEX|nr:hypothetical protein CEXT_539851 [Caerostris extrusa]
MFTFLLRTQFLFQRSITVNGKIRIFVKDDRSSKQDVMPDVHRKIICILKVNSVTTLKEISIAQITTVLGVYYITRRKIRIISSNDVPGVFVVFQQGPDGRVASVLTRYHRYQVRIPAVPWMFVAVRNPL